MSTKAIKAFISFTIYIIFNLQQFQFKKKKKYKYNKISKCNYVCVFTRRLLDIYRQITNIYKKIILIIKLLFLSISFFPKSHFSISIYSGGRSPLTQKHV